MGVRSLKQMLSILNLEDSKADSELIQATLEEEGIACVITRVETAPDFVAAIDLTRFDLLLVDYKLPSFDGMSALMIAKEKCPNVPFIFVSGSIGEDIAIDALKNGATDYVLKDKLTRLPSAVRRALKETEERIERKRAEVALQESERKYKSLVDTIVDGLYQSDVNGIFTFINQAGAEIFGYGAPDEMIGKAVIDYWVDPEERERFLAEIRHRNILKSYPIQAKKKDGVEIYLEMSSRIMEDEQGRFIGIEGILRDVTEKKVLEEQLRQSQKMEAIGQLAGGVAHDFNNILNVIIGYGTMLKDRFEKDPLAKEQLNEVLAAADRAANLTRRLLAFSRRQVAAVKPVNVNELIIGMEKMLGRIISENIAFALELTSKKIIVLADSGQIEQVLMNLVSNASFAMQDGGKLTISTGIEEIDEVYIAAYGYGKPGTYALISVTDTGSGMDAKTQQKIFEPFFTTKGVGEGTGLGLSIIYGIIKQHDGYITVYSEPGNGTIFKIYLPVFQTQGDEEKDEPVVVYPARGTETILVAEDDEALRKLIESVLKEFGYTVILAVDGADAVETFRANRDRIDLCILDLIMPKMNGKEAYNAMIAMKSNMKTLFSSGYTSDIINRKGVHDEGLDFIMKPVSPIDLLRKVREILDRGKNSDSK